MDKKLKWFAIIAGSLVGLLVITRITGLIQYYTIPTPSNEPSIKEGGMVFSTTYKKPYHGCHVIYKSRASDSINARFMEAPPGGNVFIHRLCGMPRDVLEMKNAVLFVNGKNFDENLNLYHYYKIAAHNIPYFESIAELEKQGNLMQISADTAIVNLTGEMLKSVKGITMPELYFLPGETANPAFHWYHNNQHQWTIDNFGPLKIPAGKAFVLGDNRNNALDSRYIGFINFADISGVKL